MYITHQTELYERSKIIVELREGQYFSNKNLGNYVDCVCTTPIHDSASCTVLLDRTVKHVTGEYLSATSITISENTYKKKWKRNLQKRRTAVLTIRSVMAKLLRARNLNRWFRDRIVTSPSWRSNTILSDNVTQSLVYEVYTVLPFHSILTLAFMSKNSRLLFRMSSTRLTMLWSVSLDERRPPLICLEVWRITSRTYYAPRPHRLARLEQGHRSHLRW